MNSPIHSNIEALIHTIRGQKVMLDHDLARLYGVETKNLNKAVKRNQPRFPPDFYFQLTEIEGENLRFQFGTSSLSTYGGNRYLPHAFTELGIAMLSSVLRSEQAVQVNISIMRTLFKLRDLVKKEENAETKIKALEKNTHALFKIVFERIDRIEKTTPLFPPKRRKIGI